MLISAFLFRRKRRVALLAVAGLAAAGPTQPAVAESAVLRDAVVSLDWAKSSEGWRLSRLTVDGAGFGVPDGGYTLLYAAERPATDAVAVDTPAFPQGFPEPEYRYVAPKWREALSPVALNLAGEARMLRPQEMASLGDGCRFSASDDVAEIQADWRLDPGHPGDVVVEMRLTARKPGWFSLATPTLATLPPDQLAWAVVPGYFQGASLSSDLVRAYAYGHGLPDRPVLGRERVASLLGSFLTNRHGLTLGVLAEPGTASDPWREDRSTRQEWRLGLSHMDRAGRLTPTLYHPVLGEVDSQLEAGETRIFRFRYTLRRGDWFDAARHAIYDVYRLEDFLSLKQPSQSLGKRLGLLQRYVLDDTVSMWRTEDFEGRKIGAQAYLGGVLGSDKDAMKNSDYGAMWMLASLTGDPRLVEDRLPAARAFKLAQQDRGQGFAAGAAAGQYYLSKSRRFTEEWGDYIEPVAVTYYMLLDMGNMLLFAPDPELRAAFRRAADRLLEWQRGDGSWEVAYDRQTGNPRFRDVPDLRPTFYGLLAAHRMLGDEKYLAGARRGADWLIAHAVEPGAFLGVCGDIRFAPDFATAQIAQGLLDLAEVTGEERYRQAGIATARYYVTSIYTHPLATEARKTVGGQPRADWGINQTGLSYEHGTTIGSANSGGPILLASHAGFFLRVSALTGDPLFRDLARAAAWAREAFVEPVTGVASYYWSRMNQRAGPFPHHGWWQIGWIVDYLVSEAALRSGGQIVFPRGFMAPKVGPHSSYGFAPGRILGQPAHLDWTEVDTGSPAVDTVTAKSPDGGRRYIVLLNNSAREATAVIRPEQVGSPRRATLSRDGRSETLPAAGAWRVELPAAGWAVLLLDS